MFSFTLLAVGILIFILPEVLPFKGENSLNNYTSLEILGLVICFIAVLTALN